VNCEKNTIPQRAVMRRSSTILFVALALLAPAAQAQARNISAGECHSKRLSLVDANAYVVVAENKQIQERYMYDVAVGTWRPLNRTEPDRQFKTLRISGHYVGFSGRSTACEDCNGDDSFVGVKNAATGHTAFMRFMHLTDSRDENGFEVPDMVLKPNGSVAFTVDGHWRHGWSNGRMVVKHDVCEGTRILDSSPRLVRVRSLVRRESQLRWRHGRRLRTAQLC
jgi:hypothetical protein